MCKGNFSMKVDGLTCEFNMPDALRSVDHNGKEKIWELPPRNRITAYKVDEFPSCPTNWIHGSEKAGSYFLGVEEGKGMWLDFNDCVKDEYDVAVLISVQGVNPISGQKQDKMRLEQYRSKCPIHDCDFKQDRFCEECGFEWTAQNYLTTTTTPEHYFWLDGFRSGDGKVRQYLFTEDEVRGIAHQVIGKEDKSYAIGIAFFRSKEKKPKIEKPKKAMPDFLLPNSKPNHYWNHDIYKYKKPTYFGPVHTPDNWKAYHGDKYSMQCNQISSDPGREIKTCSAISRGINSTSSASSSSKRISRNTPSDELSSAFDPAINRVVLDSFDMGEIQVTADNAPMPMEEVEITKKYEVGAGALIQQQIHPDNKSLDYYKDEPDGFIYINYADVDEIMKILEAGKRKENKNGFMEGLKVGN